MTDTRQQLDAANVDDGRIAAAAQRIAESMDDLRNRLAVAEAERDRYRNECRMADVFCGNVCRALGISEPWSAADATAALEKLRVDRDRYRALLAEAVSMWRDAYPLFSRYYGAPPILRRVGPFLAKFDSCGHPLTDIHSSGEGTSYCGACADELQRDTVRAAAEKVFQRRREWLNAQNQLDQARDEAGEDEWREEMLQATVLTMDAILELKAVMRAADASRAADAAEGSLAAAKAGDHVAAMASLDDATDSMRRALGDDETRESEANDAE